MPSVRNVFSASAAKLIANLQASPHTRDALLRGAANAYGCLVQLGALLAASVLMPAGPYAAYLLAVATVVIAEIGADFGGRTWTVRQFARRKQPATAVLWLAVRLRLGFSLATAAALAGLTLAGSAAPAPLLCLLIAFTQPAADPFVWLLQGRSRFDIEVPILVVYWTALASTVAGLAWYTGLAEAVLFGWLVCNLLRLAAEAALPTIRRLIAEDAAAPTSAVPGLGQATRECVPMGAALLLANATQQLGIFTLAWTDGAVAVALFGTAHRLASRSRFVAQNIATAYFPRLVAAIETNDPAQANRVLTDKLRILTAFCAPACLLGILLLPTLASRLWTGDLAEMGAVLVVMMPGVFLASINVANRYTLNAISLDWVEVRCHVIGAAAFLVAFFAPIGWNASHQAAAAWVFAEVAVYAARYVALRRSGLPVDLRLVRTVGVFAGLVLAAAARLSL